MIKWLKPKSDFSRNVLTLMTGTTIAQAIPIAISPILTRIYTPEDFGVFALYLSMVSLLSVASTGRYELAVMLPEKDEDAMNIVALASIICISFSCILLLIIFTFNEQITSLLGNPEISNWLYFIPVSILLASLYRGLNYWNNRRKCYKRLAANRVIQSAGNSTVNVVFGLKGLGVSGLIMGSVFGQALATIFLGRQTWQEDSLFIKNISRTKIIYWMKQYSAFPKYDIFSTFANVSSHQVTHILFNTLFGSTVAGYFYFTQRILGLPLTFVAASIADVFREEASKSYSRYGNSKDIYISTFKKLILLSFIPSILLYMFAVESFVFIFGEDWEIAGVYTQILTPMLFFRFVSSPLSFMLYIGDQQKLNLAGNVLFLLVTLLSFHFSSSALETVRLLSFTYSLVYLVYLYMSARIAKVF